MLDGDLEAAEQSATEALTLGTAAGYPDDAVTIYGGQLVRRALDAGSAATRWSRSIEQVGARQPRLRSSAPISRVAKSFDDPDDEVRQLLDTEVANDFPMFADATWLVAHVLWAERRRA